NSSSRATRAPATSQSTAAAGGSTRPRCSGPLPKSPCLLDLSGHDRLDLVAVVQRCASMRDNGVAFLHAISDFGAVLGQKAQGDAAGFDRAPAHHLHRCAVGLIIDR